MRGLGDRGVGLRRLRLQLRANRVGPPLIGDFRERRHRLDADLLLGPAEHGQQCLDHLVVAELRERADGHRYRAGRTALEHLHQSRDRALAADFGERVDGAFADPPVRVARRLDQVRHGALVLRLVQDFDGGAADILVVVLDQLQHRVDDLRPADLAERVRGATAYPPVVVLDRIEQELDRLRVADLVQHLDGRAPCIFVLVLQHRHEEPDRIGLVRLDHDIDGLVLHVDFRVPQHLADPLHVDRAVHLVERRERRRAHQLVVVLELLLQCALHRWRIEAREDIEQVQPRNRILALQSPDQLRDRGRVGDLADDAKQRRLFVRLLHVGGVQELAHAEALLLRRDDVEQGGLRYAFLRQRVEQQVRRIGAAARQRPGNTRDHTRTTLDQPAHELWKGLHVDDRRQHVDENDRCVLVRIRERAEQRFDRAAADRFQPGGGLLGLGIVRVLGGDDLGDQAIGAQVREEAHSALPRATRGRALPVTHRFLSRFDGCPPFAAEYAIRYMRLSCQRSETRAIFARIDAHVPFGTPGTLDGYS
ncbi:MAG: hypothetical protein CMLOHMNK_03512 [Steroidobacteraceae bacterium]|nr:hypothetical protein [Steroidobacteraceae bacterium]